MKFSTCAKVVFLLLVMYAAASNAEHVNLLNRQINNELKLTVKLKSLGDSHYCNCNNRQTPKFEFVYDTETEG